MPTVIDHPTFGTVGLGRLAPISPPPRLRMANYIMRKMPTPPTAVDYTTKAAALHDNLGNLRRGNCTIAAAFHITGAMLGNAGGYVHDINEANCVQLYNHLTDGKDTGLAEPDVLNYWRNTGLFQGGYHKIDGFVGVDPTDEVEVKTALWLFENLYCGAMLPLGWVHGVRGNGFIWGANAGLPDKKNGHAFCCLGYGQDAALVDTWGLVGHLTWDAIAYYCNQAQDGELYTVVSRDAVARATGKAPNGFDYSQLLADLDSLQ